MDHCPTRSDDGRSCWAAWPLYALATLGCGVAGNIESLWLFRTFQGLSAGSGLVVGRAIIRDRFHGPEAQRLMSQMTMVFGVAPALAPVVGGSLLNLFGWRSIFVVLFAVVVALLGWAAAKLPETLPPAQRQPLQPGILWRNYRTVLTRPAFLLLSCMTAFNFAAFFTYIAAAPAFLIDLLGVTTWGFAWLFVPMIGGVMIGAFISGRLAGRRSPQRTIELGYRVVLVAVIVNALVCMLLPARPAWNVAPIMIFTMGSSIIMPTVTLLLLDLFPTMRGLTSSLQGFVQFALFRARRRRHRAGARKVAGRSRRRNGGILRSRIRLLDVVQSTRVAISQGHSMILIRFLTVALVGILIASNVHAANTTAPASSLPVIQLTVGGNKVSAEVAVTMEQRAKGLMHRFSLRPDSGMVFVFPRAEPLGFWMKNTFVPLSIAFIDSTGKILNVEDMAPQTETTHWSKGPALYALEMRKGWFREHGVQAGDRVEGLPGASKE